MKIKVVADGTFNINELYILLLRVLLFFMICVPRNMQLFKVVILFVLVILTLKRGVKWTQYQKELLVFYLVYAVLATIVGIIKNNEFSNISDFIRLNITYTLLFALVFQGEITSEIRSKIINTLFHAVWFVCGYSILLLLVGIGIWPREFFVDLGNANVGIHEGYTHITNTNLSFFLYLLPMVVWLAINNFSLEHLSKKTVKITAIIAIIVTLASGRRILWLSIILPFVVYTSKAFIRCDKKQLSKIFLLMLVGIVGLVILTKTGYFDVDALIERFISAFRRTEMDRGVQLENVRFKQITELWKGFWENPILGSGAGGVLANGYKRAANGVAFEMTYNYILFQSGIIGVSVYVSFFMIFLYRLIKGRECLVKEQIIFLEAITLGFVMAIIGNGTNPYFSSSFDFMWMLYIPFFFLGMIKDAKERVYSVILEREKHE